MLRHLMRNVMYGPFRRMILILLLVVLVPILSVHALLSYLDYREELGSELKNHLEVANGVARAFESYVGDLLGQEYALGKAFATLQPTPAQIEGFLNDSLKLYPSLRALSWQSPEGRVLVSTNPRAVGVDYGDRQDIKEVIAGRESVVSDVLLSRTTGQPTFSLTRGIRDGQGKLLGIMAAVVAPNDLWPVLKVPRAHQGGVVLRDSRGLPVCGFPEVAWTWEEREKAAKAPLAAEARTGKEVTGLLIPVKGERRFVAAVPISEPAGWSAWAGRPVSQVLPAIRREIIIETTLLILVGVLSLGSALTIGRLFVAPLDRLREHAVAVGRGDFNRTVSLTGPAELELFAASFNAMSGQLRKRDEERERILSSESRARAEAEAAKERVSGILESISDAFLSFDPEGRLTYCNAEAERVLGMQRSEVIDRDLEAVQPNGAGAFIRRRALERTRGGEPAVFTVPYEPLGAWFEVHAYPSPAALSLYIQDITERRRADDALRESEEAYRQLFEAESDAIFLIENATGRIVQANGAACALYGYDKETLLGMRNTELSAEPEDTDRVTKTTPPDAGQVIVIPIRRHRKKDGTVFPVEITGRFFVRNGVPVHLAAIRDISRRLLAEEKLKQAKAELEDRYEELKKLDVIKDGLLRDVSHELKTPVAKQAMQIEILKQALGPEWLGKVEKIVAVMEGSVRRQERVIRNLLDLSRLETGGRKMAIGAVPLQDVLKMAAGDYEFLTRTKGVLLTSSVEPLTVLADGEMLWHVFSNLLNNAIKFRKRQGPCHIGITASRDGSQAVVTVSDDGIGLSPEELSRAFERFYQVSAATEGSGVGLTICREIVELMGGSIRIDSQGPDKGATVEVRLPLAV